MLLIQVNSFVLVLAAICIGAEAYSWQSSKDGFPKNAVLAGYNNEGHPLFVGRRKNENAGMYLIANVDPTKQNAFIPYIGKEMMMADWEYLIGDCFFWTRSYDGYVPRNAVLVDSVSKIKSYVGRGNTANSVTPGMISVGNKKNYPLKVPFNGGVSEFDKYEVLLSCEELVL